MFKVIHCLLIASFLQIGLSAQNPFSVKERSGTDNQNIPQVDRVINGQHKSIINSTGKSQFKTLPSVRVPKNVEDLKITHSTITGMPILIKGHETPFKNSLNSEEGVQQATFAFLEAVEGELCLENAREEFKVTYQRLDKKSNVNHIRLQQKYQNIDIYGADIAVHINAQGEMTMNGRSQPSPVMLDLTPQLMPSQAKELAIADVSTRTNYVEMNEECQNMYHYHEPIDELVIYPSDENFGYFKLVYHLTVRPNFLERYEYFIDAHSGELVNFFNNTCSLVGEETTTATDLNGFTRTINTYLYQNNYYLYDASRPMYSGPANGLPQAGDGGIETLDFQNNPPNNPNFADIATSNNNFNQNQYRVAVSAHHNAGECYEYFTNTFNRNSINGQGGDIISFINVADDNGGGLDNAFWNGQYMFYGSGNQAFQPLAGALDVAGHEMSHGVIQNTANLIYQGQSGAINEHIADVFGVMIDRNDWQLGEDVVNTSTFQTGFLRDMQNPNNGGSGLGDPGWQPQTTSEMYTGSQDNGGVHFNSGIPNHAYYLMATDIGKDKAEQIYYKALTDYLTRNSQFIDLRIAVLEAANNLNGISSNDIAAIENAFADVGIGEGSATQQQEDLEVNSGDDFILSVDVSPTDDNTLYISPPNPQGGSDFQPITTTSINRKPSITDNGEHIYFVGEDKHLYHIDLSTGTADEEQLSQDAVWENVAVSKDGNRLALITTEIDSAIYVFDLTTPNGSLVKFDLYNPTFTQGVESGGVKYADALEWDYSGEYVLYDAFNQIPGFLSDDIEYWDMGIMKVWDNATDNFDDGTIQKIFTNLPAGVSVGNPTFAKNTPYIFAFDYLEGNSIQLRAVNLETGNIGIINENSSTLNFASYSGDDSQIAFSNLSGTSEVVSIINLQSNKIQSTGSASNVISVAKWPVWYVNGERILIGVEDLPSQIENLSVSPNPFNENLEIQLDLVENSRFHVKVANLSGQVVARVAEQFYGMGAHNIQIPAEELPSGTYLVQLEGESFNQTVKVVKMK